MKVRRRELLASLLALTAKLPGQTKGRGESGQDPVLQSMLAELERARTLRLPGAEAPYFVSYALDDAENYSASATLGGLVSSRRQTVRLPRVQVRVGDPKFDNTNYVLSDFAGGSRYDPDQAPLENDVVALRQHWWLATDRLYKAALEAIARKRAALQNLTVATPVPDFASAEPVQRLEDVRREPVNEEQVTRGVRTVSAVFGKYPAVTSSGVDVDLAQSVYYFVNSEGTRLRVPDRLHSMRIRAAGQAPDGMVVRDSAVLQALRMGDLPREPELLQIAEAVARNVTALARAPRGEEYAGPVLFEGEAAAQVFAEVLGPSLSLPRRPVGEPGRPVPFSGSELESRLGTRILPDWMDVADDPTLAAWEGKPLVGTYAVDLEGVPGQRVALIEQGRLRAFLLTRQPVKRFNGSNGHARLPGGFGANNAVYSNLLVQARESVPLADLKKRLIELCRERDLPYGVLVRKMDFPSTASLDEARRILAGGQGGRPVSSPVLLVRVYPDGREELVRGLRFRGLNTRAFRDILAASKETAVAGVQNNLAPFALIGAATFVAPCSVVAPSVLFEDLELEPLQDDQQKPPVVPPPTV